MTKNKGIMRKVLQNVIRGSVLGSILGFVWGEVVIVWVAFSNFFNDFDAFFRILKFGQTAPLASLVVGFILGSVLGWVFALIKGDTKLLLKILISGSVVGILHFCISAVTRFFDISHPVFGVLNQYPNFWLAIVGFYIMMAVWFGVYFHLVHFRGSSFLGEED